jgi:RNA-directed DNA polymerase
LLLKSQSAKLLAVRQVAQDNQGKRTAGIDGIKSLSPHQRLALTKHLVVEQKASPVRRLWIPKPGTEEKRQLGIPMVPSYCTSMQIASELLFFVSARP